MNFQALFASAARAFSLGHRRSEVGHATRTGAHNHAGQYFYLGPDKAITKLADGHFLYVDPRDDTVSAHLIARGYWEAWIHKVVCSLVSRGDHVIDVGANVGYYTVALALKVGAQGSVTALEANPDLARLLRHSIVFNGYSETVSVLAKAASDQAGPIRFTASQSNSGGGHIYAFDDALGPDTIVHTVEAVRLDDLDIPSPKLIRIDAEGSEGLILRGAERLLERPDIVICMEWDVVQMASRTDITALLEWLVHKGFNFWRINGDASLTALTQSEMPQQASCDVVVARELPSGAR